MTPSTLRLSALLIIPAIIVTTLVIDYIAWRGFGAGFNDGYHLAAAVACEDRENNCQARILEACKRLKVRCAP